MHASRDSIPAEMFGRRYETRLVEWNGVTAYFERIPAGTDFTAYYDLCNAPHWGYIFKGKVRFIYKDGHEEIVSAGDMYYIPAGHKFQVLEDTETVEFSPTAEYREHMNDVLEHLRSEAHDKKKRVA